MNNLGDTMLSSSGSDNDDDDEDDDDDDDDDDGDDDDDDDGDDGDEHFHTQSGHHGTNCESLSITAL